MPHIILLGTLDTKLHEFIYLYSRLKSSSPRGESPVKVTLIDCSRQNVSNDRITISQSQLLSRYGDQDHSASLMDMPRGEVIKYLSKCATRCVKHLISQGGVHGIMSAGGSGGTSLAAAVMREAAPIGMPKLIVSTIASGDTGSIVGETDITLMYSVVDIAGRNDVLENVLSNASAAMAGMSSSYESMLEDQKLYADLQRKKRIGATMFGVTTPCIDKIREYLESRYQVEMYVFHATGHGGRAMERLIEEGRLDAVLDLTTTEICDHLMGGNMSAGPNRLEAALKAGIPNIISLGATDMVNFGQRSTVPFRYNDRKLLEHNPTVTLMRTTEDECRQIGEFIVEKITKFAKDPSLVQVWIPAGGVSIIAVSGAPFADVVADRRLVQVLKAGLFDSGVKVVEDSRDINDPAFAVDVAEAMVAMLLL